jgi:N-acetylmuramoyl-L-alanine amidase
MKKTVIIECGHGGMINGVYQDLAGARRDNPDPKQYTFSDGTVIHEGVNNRVIGKMLIAKLIVNNIPYKDLNAHDNNDMSLVNRVKVANEIYRRDKSAWLLSLHSNKMTFASQGSGNGGRGCENFIAINASQKSVAYAEQLEKSYKDAGLKWRGTFHRDLYMVKNTACPAVLMETLFYDNVDDAEILISDSGRKLIVDALYDAIVAINKL